MDFILYFVLSDVKKNVIVCYLLIFLILIFFQDLIELQELLEASVVNFNILPT